MEKQRVLARRIYFLTALALILGFMVMISINSYRANEVKEENNNREIIAYIQSKEAENIGLEQQIAAVRAEIEAIRSEQAETTYTSSRLSSALSLLNQYAGLTALSGSGISVMLDDNKVGAELAQKNNPDTYNAENYIIHDKDILYLVRAVAPYAEAVAVNGIRLVDTTSIRCVGTVIMVNSARLAPPYELIFLGDAQVLNEALTASSRYHRLQYMSMPVSVTESEELSVPAYTGSYKPSWAVLVNEAVTDTEETAEGE